MGITVFVSQMTTKGQGKSVKQSRNDSLTTSFAKRLHGVKFPIAVGLEYLDLWPISAGCWSHSSKPSMCFVIYARAFLLIGFSNSIPKMKETVDRLLLENTDELSKLPTPPTKEPSAEVLLRVTSFCQDVQAAVMGERFKELVQANRKHYADFDRSIFGTCPDFRPFEGHISYLNPGLVDVEESDTDTEDDVLDLFDVRKHIVEYVAATLLHLIKEFTFRSQLGP